MFPQSEISKEVMKVVTDTDLTATKQYIRKMVK